MPTEQIPLPQGSTPSLQGTSFDLQGSQNTIQSTGSPTPAPAAPAPAPKPVAKVAPKAVVTSNQAREVTAENQKNLTQTMQAITPQPLSFMNETIDVDPASGKIFGVRPNQSQEQPQPTPTEQKQVKTDSATGNTTTTTTTTGTPSPETIESPDQKAAREENEAITKETEQFNSLIDGRIMKNDAATETMLSAIQQKYAKQRAEMEKYNDAVVGGTNTQGFRSGRTRYANEIQQGILGEEMRQGALRLAEIDQAESNAIFQAQQANEDKNFALLNEKMKAAKDARSEKRLVTQDLYDKTLKMEELSFKRSQEDRAVREQDLKEEQFALSVQNTLADNSRQALATILTNFGGLAFEDLDEEAQAQLDELAQSIGIPNGILRSGMQTIKERQMMEQVLQFGEKQALEQQKLAMLQQQRDIQNQIALTRLAISGSRSGGSSAASELVNAVLQNPELFNQLTPSDKAKVIPALNAAGFTGFGKALSDTAIKQISDSQIALSALDDLRSTILGNEQYIGPISGLQALNPYSEARKVQAEVDRVRQRVGKALEGGVLRKEDEDKYKKILATITDTPETAISKIDSLIKDVNRDIETYTTNQQLAGRNTTGIGKTSSKNDDPLGLGL